MKRILFLVLAGMTVLSGLSQASGSVLSSAASDKWEENAKTALEELRLAYVQEDSSRFFGGLSDRSVINTLDFKAQVTRHWTDFSQTDLVITVDHALKSDTKAVLKTHWQKRAVRDATGQSEKSEGHAQFVFELMLSMRLVNVQGDSPF